MGRDAIDKHRPALLAASDALDALLAPAQCPQLVQAIVQVGPDVLRELGGAGPEGLAGAAQRLLVGSCCTQLPRACPVRLVPPCCPAVLQKCVMLLPCAVHSPPL